MSSLIVAAGERCGSLGVGFENMKRFLGHYLSYFFSVLFLGLFASGFFARDSFSCSLQFHARPYHGC